MKQLLFSLALAGCASTSAPPVTPAPVVAVERAFASRALEVGWIPAFCEYSATDGEVIVATGITNAHDRLCAREDDGNRDLFWGPEFAGIARSGDLGFTSGPFSGDAARTPVGRYFTVWKRQADGSWEWIFDGGPGPGPGVPAYSTPVTEVTVSSSGVGDEAATQVRALEEGATHALASGARQYRVEGVVDPRYRITRVEASAAGDLVFVLGEASWADRRGFFSRIWQYRPEGWRVLYEQVIPAAD